VKYVENIKRKLWLTTTFMDIAISRPVVENAVEGAFVIDVI
jgi:hypothetical protein